MPLAGLWTNALDAQALAAARARFDEIHARIHGHAASEKGVELVSYRVRLRVSVPKFEPQPAAAHASAPAPAPAAATKGTRRVFFVSQESIETEIIDREKLPVGATFAGPAIVEQFDATTVVPPGWAARVDRFHNLALEFRD